MKTPPAGLALDDCFLQIPKLPRSLRERLEAKAREWNCPPYVVMTEAVALFFEGMQGMSEEEIADVFRAYAPRNAAILAEIEEEEAVEELIREVGEMPIDE